MQQIIALGRDFVTEGRDQGTVVFPNAECKFFLVADPIAEAVIRELNPGATSLHGHYGEGVQRAQSYEAMVEEMMGSVRAGKRTVAYLTQLDWTSYYVASAAGVVVAPESADGRRPA